VADAGSSHPSGNAGCLDDFVALPRLLSVPCRAVRAGQRTQFGGDAARLHPFVDAGVSEYITLTVRRIDEGAGSQWLTRELKRGDYLWLSDAMGEFTCEDKAEDKFLMLAAGCGVTPIMSMRRWLAKYRPQADVQVIYNIRSPQDVIFADEWRQYPVTLVAENNATHGFVAGRLTTELLKSVPDLATRTVMTCGPAPYMDWVEQEVTALGVTRFFKEKFFTPVRKRPPAD
jgi:NADH oxidoreductase Hcr